ncbi:MAG: hypothetical protein QNJ41_25590 [Xenococcaceae cyanobacterium MO_188.B32]|nr:hypothetical protein [Xenococcaceae cyanobacterium MO_188.B32]
MIRNCYSLTSILLKCQIFWFAPSFWAFAILNTPSLKLLYFSPLVNIVAILGLYSSYLFGKAKISTSQARVNCLTIFSLFWGILLISGIIGSDASVNLELIFRYVSVYLALVALIFFINKKAISQIIAWQIIWGTALSLYQITYQFPLHKLNKNIHYNTIAIPMASSLIAILGILLFNKVKIKSKLSKIILWLCLSCNLLSLTSLPGRGPLIYPIIVVVFFSCLKYNYFTIFQTKNLLKKSKNLLIFILLIYSSFNNIQTKLDNWALQRYQLFFSAIHKEPRLELYQSSIEAIINSIFLGYGLNSSVNIVGFYPHNIFLEILLSAGIIALIPFLFFIIWYLKKISNSALFEVDNIPIAMTSCYLFLTWNTSFDLASSYVCLGSMVMFICTSSQTNQLNKIRK